MPKYDPTARPKTKADKEKERREKEQAQVIKPSQRDPRHVTDPLAYGNRYDPVRDAQPVPELNKKKPSVVDTLLSGIKSAASRAEKDHYSGYNVDDVTNANYNKGKKPESGGKKPERRTPSYMTSSGWTDEVKSYTPEKPEKPQKPTKSQQWAEDLSADAQRAEQRETRKAETKKTVSPVDALVPKPSQTNSQDQTRLTDTATGNRSEWFPEMSAPEEKTVVPPAPSGYAGFVDDEDDGVDEVPTGEGSKLSPYEQRQADKKSLEDERERLMAEHAELIQRTNYGRIGVDYTPEDMDRLVELESQIKDLDGQIDELGRNVEWEGRDALVKEYAELRHQIEMGARGNGIEERYAEVVRLLQEGDAAAGNPEQFYTADERIGGAVTGGVKDIGSNLANAAGTAINFAGYVGEQYGNANPNAGYAVDDVSAALLGPASEAERAAWAAEMQNAQSVGGKVQEFADSLSESAARDIEMAKGGLNQFGQAGVDVIDNLIGMGFDMAVAPLTGGNSLVPMFVRTFGGAAAEARRDGADPIEQMAYGLTSAGIEIATEKVSDGLAGIYGAGAADELTDALIDRLADSTTGKAILNVIASAGGEGAEEVMSDLLAPFAQRIYDDQAIQRLLDEGYPLDEILYDFLIGAAIGSLGGTADVTVNQNANTNSQQNAAQPAEGLTAEDQRNEQRQQRQQTPDEILAEAATPKAEEERKTPGEERAEEQTPEAPREEAPIEEAPTEEETPAKEQPTPEEMGEKQSERKPETPAEILAAEASKKGKAAEAPSEAAESKKGEDHESVPPSTQESPSEAQEELNSGSADSEQSSPVQSGQDDGTIEEQRKAERSEHHTAARSVEEANRALKEIERFEQNPDYRSSSYSNAENARAVVDKTINDLRNAGLTNAEELRNQAQELRERSKEAQRMVDKIEALAPEGEDIADPNYNYWYDEVDAAENEAYALDEVADFIEANEEAFLNPTAPSGQQAPTSNIANQNKQNGGKADEQNASQAKQVHTAGEGETKRGKYDLGENHGGYSREERLKTNHILHKFHLREVIANGGKILTDEETPPKIREAVRRFRELLPEVEISVVYDENDDTPAWHFGANTRDFDGGIFVNAAKIRDAMLADLVTADEIIGHETGHYWLEASGLNNGEWFNALASALPKDAPPEILPGLRQSARVFMKGENALTESKALDEVACDIIGNVSRMFRKNPKVLEYIRPYLLDVLSDELPVSLAGYLEEGHTKRANSQSSADSSATASNPGGGNDPGANKSWADSLTAQEAPAENDSGERPDDDMTPLNEQSRERDEERREKQKAETKKKLGKDNYDRMSKALEKLDAWDKEYTERYGETAKDENGHDIVDDELNETKTSAVHELATRVRSMLEGEESVQSFAEYYESLRPAEGETNQTDANYLYDGALAEMLNQLADAERALNLSEKGSPADGDVAREEFAKASEAFAGSLETRLGRLEEQFKNRTKANEEITSHAKGEKTGRKNSLDRQKKRFWETQMRVDTFFKMLGGFSEKSKVMNNLAQRGADSTIKRNNVRNSGYEFFHDLSTNPETAKAWKDIESGKTKGNVDIPGLGKASMNYELAMLKTLMTNGALDHIARFGAQFVNEADYYKGYNNNGRGETESYQAQHRLTRDVLDQMAKENLQAANELAERGGGKGKKINGKAIYDEKIRILKELRSELMKDVSSNEVALAGYNASIEAMKYLANEINDVTLRLYGVAKALQGSNYWPMQVIGRGNNLQFLNNNAFTMEEASYLQHRKGGSGTLQINPFAEVMSSYIDRASKFVGFGELNSDLMMMSKEIGVGHGKHDSEKQSIQSVIQKQAGSSAAKWMTRYMETLNGTAKQPSKLGSMLRSNLASSSLTLNPGVALKQSPSYFNAAGIVDLDILIKNRLITLGALRSAKSYDKNPLIQEINKRTGILESRKSGTVVLGEQDGRAMFGKLKKLLPNWITNRDVSTVSNLALACAEQVKRNNPGIDTKSDAFYEQTAKLLEQAVIKSQPVYDAEFRPDYLRSDNEIVRMLSMFRTQQSQNLNQLMQAYGELEAARREGGDVKAAEKKRNQVVAGYAMSQVAFAILSTAARVLTHKTKDYEDEEGNIDLGKVAKRVGLDFLTTAGGVVWFGDTLSKVAIDAATGLYAKATGKKDAATSEFFSMSDNTISVIDDVIGSTIKVFQNPTPKTIKNEVFDLAQSVGLPARNFYNILNSAFMYGTDAFRKNPDNYDDAIDMWMTESKKSDTTRAKDTTEAAVKALKKGDAEKGNTLLATLDYSNKDVASAVKKAAGDAYVRGDIDEKTYRKILRDTAGAAAEAEVKAAEAALKAKEIDGKTYAEILKNAGKTDDAAINKAVHSKDIDKTIAALTEQDPKKYEALIENINDAKENALTGTSKSNAVARLILDAAMSKEGQAAFMEKYTSSDYFKAYEAASVGYKAEKVIEVLANIDENKDDQFTQEELYAYFKDTGHSEIVRAVWRANGWKTSFDDYRKQKAKTAEYDKVAGENESYEFGETEKKLKELKSGNTMHIQTGGGDPAMFKIIGGMGLSAKDTDTVVDKYVSSKTKTNYHVLRDGGYEPAKAMELLTAVDTDGKGTLSQKEMWAYYKEHKDDEAVIEALWNAQGYKKDWKTYKKKQK